jgi:dynein heavy chain
MGSSHKDPQALVVVSKPKMLEKLRYSESLLEDINRGLNDYLEKKRLFFPRFFFLSNDELLEILSETKDPLRVEPHLKKCFEGISKLSFTQTKKINAIQSSENELVSCIREIAPEEANGLVEKWLQQVEEVMRLSLRMEAQKSIDAYERLSRKDWVTSFPGQIVLACSIVYWTSEATQVRDMFRNKNNSLYGFN